MDFALGDTSNLTSVLLKRIKKAVSHVQCVGVPFLLLKSKIVIDVIVQFDAQPLFSF